MRQRHFAMASAVLLLSACAGSKPRPAAPQPATTQAPTAPRQGDAVAKTAVKDDVGKPQSQRYKDAKDSGPAFPPSEVAKLVEPVPRNEPRARYGNKSPYTVLGKTYSVLDTHVGYVERGVASWYGNKFHGYMTSSMEPYDMHQFSAAHKSLPLPSYARVTNLENGKSVIVRVNDRGPFHDNRLIDLSYAAAVRIGVWPKGTGLVEVQAIDADHPNARPTLPQARAAVRAAQPPAITGKARLFLQVGAFGQRDNANRVAAAVTAAGIEGVRVDAADVAGRTVYRVRVGPLSQVDKADALTPRIERLGFGTPRVVIDD